MTPDLDYYTNEDGEWWVVAEGWADRADAMAALAAEDLIDSRQRLIPIGPPTPEVVPCDSEHDPGDCHCPNGSHWDAQDNYIECDHVPADQCAGTRMLACYHYLEVDTPMDYAKVRCCVHPEERK